MCTHYYTPQSNENNCFSEKGTETDTKKQQITNKNSLKLQHYEELPGEITY